MIDPTKIRAARLAKDMTQEEAANAAGLASRQSWNNIERGRTNVTVATLDRVAKVLGVKAKELLK